MTLEVTSPNYPSNYRKNAFKLWTIQAPKGFVVSIRFYRLNLRNDHAFLYFRDKAWYTFSLSATSCYQWIDLSTYRKNDILTSTSSSIQLIFTSDYEDAHSGFRLELYAIQSQGNGTNKSCKYIQ